tara:strand:+ start:9976 stop:10944 length:969 start_codon:yes stop_codon:yes gene_type:complete
MDDYNVNSLIESKNEWCSRLLNILSPCLISGIKYIFDEAYQLCLSEENEEKYLMTFQNLLNNVPKWSDEIVNNETQRIIEFSGCNYLEDLLTCVHIINLKSLTCARVGIKHKKIDIDIPNINQFIHKSYILLARKIYINVYLFEKDIPALQIQKNNRELELICKECILNSIRESIPIETLLKNYLDESKETEVEVEEKREEVIDKELLEIKKNQELEKIKENIKEEISNEIKKETTLQDINKDLNTINNEETKVEVTSKDDNEINIINNTLKKELSSSDDLLEISNTELDLELNTHNLDDKDMFSEKLELEPEIDLDIEELK